ncbi:MAG: ABC transporter permease [Chloroflexi bacterium]|nr:ABC transporter permease [Chloroflexota bacterium]
MSENQAPNAEASAKTLKFSSFKFSTLRQYGIIFAIVAVFVILSTMTDAFATKRNMLNVLDQASQVGLASLGATVTIIGGGFDLSIGSVYAATGCLAAIIAKAGHPVLGLISGMFLGLVLGYLNGLIITKFQINSFVATLASGLIIRGIAYVLTDGLLIQIKDERFAVLGRGYIGEAKIPVYFFFGFAALVWFLLAKTTFGRYVYAIGGNEEAARLSGIRTDMVRTLTFAISGFSAGIAGVIAASRISTGQANVGDSMTMSAIAAVVIGGTSIVGGEGAVWRTLFGVMLLQLISNGMNINNVPPFYQLIVQGAVILFAVTLDAVRQRKT